MNLFLQLGVNNVVEVIPEHKEALRDIASSPQCKFLGKFLEEQAFLFLGQARSLLKQGKYDEARALESYATCLEDVAILVDKGISEALTDKSA